MLFTKNHGFKRQYVYGGAGIFDSIAGFLAKLFTSDAARQIASSALNVGKTAALDAGKKDIEKGVTKALTHRKKNKSKSEVASVEVSKRAQDILSKYIGTQINEATDVSSINFLIGRSGVGNKAIAIQDLVWKLNTTGAGLERV